jgi:tetratricopeptide (TPR) repeat protein
MAAECVAQPVVIVLEDLHWGDLPTVSFMDAALRNLQDLPLFVVAAARPEVHDLFPGLWADRGMQEIRLAPLVRSAAESFVKQVLGDGAPGDEIARIVDRAAGNAFYLEELIRAVADGRGDALPETVLAMVEARLERMDADGRRVLRAASVFGQVFWRGGLVALLGGSFRTADLDDWLGELVRRELLMARRRSRFPGDIEYAFRHALVREAAYAMLTADDRALGHRLAAQWLEDSGEADAAILAEHFERGGLPQRAIDWYRKAAEHALEGNDFVAATVRAEAAIASGATGDMLGMLRLLQATAAEWRGDTNGSLRLASDALAHLVPGTPHWFDAAGSVAVAARKLGSLEVVRDIAARVRQFDAHPMVSVERLVGTARVTASLYLLGEIAAGAAALTVLERFGAGLVAREPAVGAWVHYARSARAVWSAEIEEDILSTQAAVEAFERAGDRRNACASRAVLGFSLQNVGQHEEAERVLRQAIEAADRMGLRATSLMARQNLGTALARMGRVDEALVVEREALEGYRQQGDAVWEAICSVYLGLFSRLQGGLEEAENTIRAAIPAVVSVPPMYAAGLSALALVQLDRRDARGASASATEAMRLFRQVGGVLEGESMIRLVYAEALAATGDLAGARVAIADARNALVGRADAIKNPVWRRGFLERVRENVRTLARAGEWLR